MPSLKILVIGATRIKKKKYSLCEVARIFLKSNCYVRFIFLQAWRSFFKVCFFGFNEGVFCNLYPSSVPAASFESVGPCRCVLGINIAMRWDTHMQEHPHDHVFVCLRRPIRAFPQS